MPKRKRSQFETIPTDAYWQHPFFNTHGRDRAGIQAYERQQRRHNRLDMQISRQIPMGVGINQRARDLYRGLLDNERDTQMARAFGLIPATWTSSSGAVRVIWAFDQGRRAYDRERFFERTGRLGFVIQKWQEAIDRRRREAYIRLRSWLPMEVVRRILQLTPTGSGLYGSVSGRFVVGAPRELLN